MSSPVRHLRSSIILTLQAGIDAASELADFLWFNHKFAEDLCALQSRKNAPGVYDGSCTQLERFVYTVKPFDFTAIG